MLKDSELRLKYGYGKVASARAFGFHFYIPIFYTQSARMILYYLTAYFLLWNSPAAALPQGQSQTSQLPPATAATDTISSATVEPASLSTATFQSLPEPSQTSASTIPANATDENKHKCDFEEMQDFFDYATERQLNITVEVQNCQNLCLLTYGVGNPDLSGIGVSVSRMSKLQHAAIFLPREITNMLFGR
jgi:hypothetical protein